jgi:hypothetical protein
MADSFQQLGELFANAIQFYADVIFRDAENFRHFCITQTIEVHERQGSVHFWQLAYRGVELLDNILSRSGVELARLGRLRNVEFQKSFMALAAALFTSAPGERGIEGDSINPGGFFGLSTKGWDGFPELQTNILKQIILVLCCG